MVRAVWMTIVWMLSLVAMLFLPARSIDWPAGWMLIGFFAVISVVGFAVLPADLIAERSRAQPDARLRDLVLAGPAFVFLYPGTLVVCGLDFRFQWSPPIFPALRWLAFGLCIAGYGFSLWAARSNPFFSTVVRIQHERGHRVIDQGPYALVRHPGYAGPIVAHLVIPIALGCLWGLIPALMGIAFLALRTRYEDERLAAELAGYREYRQRVRWRLIPGIW
jgi:protein-S-isoprenylcysteine O-methyltransferase Ste14